MRVEQWLPLVVAIFVALLTILSFKRVVIYFRSKISSRSSSLNQWAKEVRFSNQQLAAMRSLWQWHRTGRKPVNDPLELLSPSELADLLSKIGLDYKPEDYQQPGEAQLRDEFIEQLQSKGMEYLQAEIITGMQFGRLGPANHL